jgi:HEAT repeat protein
MAGKPVQLDPLLEQLRSPQSPKRRSAAKKLRKLGRPEAGPALLEALRAEVRDPRTWETQYQMVMALAECRHTESLPFLRELARTSREATMVTLALGDAIVRLARSEEHDATPILELLRSGDEMLTDGAFRAMAMLRLVPTPEARFAVVQYASRLPLESGKRFWVVAAAAGWEGSDVQAFLAECQRSPRQDVRDAAAASLAKTYKTWTPL